MTTIDRASASFDPTAVLSTAKTFVEDHLAALCADLDEMKATAVLPDGRMRELIRMLNPLAGGSGGLSLAEGLVTRSAIRRVVVLLAEHPAAPAEEGGQAPSAK